MFTSNLTFESVFVLSLFTFSSVIAHMKFEIPMKWAIKPIDVTSVYVHVRTCGLATSLLVLSMPP